MKITEYFIEAVGKKDLCAAFVADTHDKPYDKIVKELKSRRVDFILMTGDIVFGHDDKIKRGFKMLSEFVAIAPTFMSLGNHEGGAVDLVRSKCKSIGVKLLEEESVDFEGFLIGGLTSGYIFDRTGIKENHWRRTPEPDLKWLKSFASKEGYKILLSHHPEYFDEYIRDLDIDLTLSGHAHGGQWRFFDKGLFAPGQGILPKYTAGFHYNRFIISRGLANNAWAPRLFNPRELIFINFKSAK
jgi:predicted MPP superfamily phosphohydrolase